MTQKRYRRRITALTALSLALSGQGLTARAQSTMWEAYTDAGNRAVEYGDYAQAEKQYQYAVAAGETMSGKKGAGTSKLGQALNNLAEIYRIQGRYAEAEPLYLRAIQVKEKALGNTHPSLATSYNGLADLYRAQGRFTQAEPMYLSALKINEHPLRANQRQVANTLTSLADMYRQTGRNREADALDAKVTQIRWSHP
ncbi:MAG: tetratricopeptide repeat protein [Candidatus Melainabacteria bacterium]